MTIPPPDRSRDRRIEDPTNLWIIHPAGRGLLPWFVARGISANAVSVAGLALGTLAAFAYSNWTAWPWAIAGLLLSVAGLIADALDGSADAMVEEPECGGARQDADAARGLQLASRILHPRLRGLPVDLGVAREALSTE